MRTLIVIAGTTVALALGAPTALAAAPSGAGGAAVDARQAVLAAASNQVVNDARTLSGRGVADASIANRFLGVPVAAGGNAALAVSEHGVADPSITNRYAGAPVGVVR